MYKSTINKWSEVTTWPSFSSWKRKDSNFHKIINISTKKSWRNYLEWNNIYAGVMLYIRILLECQCHVRMHHCWMKWRSPYTSNQCIIWYDILTYYHKTYDNDMCLCVSMCVHMCLLWFGNVWTIVIFAIWLLTGWLVVWLYFSKII